MRKILILLFVVLCSNANATTFDSSCLAHVIFMEARGEGILTQRAVMEVVQNRAKILNKSICNIVFQPGQFPYMIYGVKPVPKYFLTRVKFLHNMPRVLPENAFYFNDTKLSFGKFYAKIGNMYFNTK